MSSVAKKGLDFEPRDYQLFYLEKAKKQNVIICLGTGSGKTYITIMVLKEFGIEIKTNKKKAVFLAPTTTLVDQQANEIRKHTNFDVKEYYGVLGVDTWDEEKWKKEIDDNEILCFTPDIFYNLISKKAHWGNLKRKNNRLEETKHPYKKTMAFIIKEDFHNKIRIIGTTASVINGCPDAYLLPECSDAIEKTFNAKILGEFEFDPRYLAEPEIQIWLFENKIPVNTELNDLFVNLINDFEEVLNKRSIEAEDYFKNMLNIQAYLAEKPLLKPEYVKRLVRDINEVHMELGIFAAYLVCIEFKNELNRFSESVSDKNLLVLVNLCLQFLKLFEDVYTAVIDDSVLSNLNEDKILNLSSSKLLRLLDILERYYSSRKEFTCLVFVDRVLFSFGIAKYLQELSKFERYSFLKTDFFVGQNNDYLNFRFIRQSVKNFKLTMNNFKTGKLNTLITTAVLEEGIDIGKCNLVIRYNIPVTYREFVQSKGRARAKGSYYVMIDDKPKELVSLIQKFDKTERFLTFKFEQSKKSSFEESVLPNGYEPEIDEENQEEFLESKTGAMMYLHEASPFLNRYILKKGNNEFAAQYRMEEREEKYRLCLSLQGVTPIKEDVYGKFYEDSEDAFKSACLAACKVLYEMNQLDDHFIPIKQEEVIKKCNLVSNVFKPSEATEMNFLFNNILKRERLFFKKKINNASFFRNFCNTNIFSLYEIKFDTEDQCLLEGKSLGLLTELKLNKYCYSTTLYSSKYQCQVKLDLVQSNLALKNDQLSKIDEFTKSIFISTIARLKKKRDDVKFDPNDCLFKFVYLDEREVDFIKMAELVNSFDEMQNQFDSDPTGKLVKAIHTNTDYRVISTKTGKFPDSKFIFYGTPITFNKFFKTQYDKVINNQEEELIQVEKADLTSMYSLFVRPDKSIKENKTSKFDVFLPKELCVLSPYDKSDYKKLCCLPPLIYRIKQKIILKFFQASLSKKVVGSKDLEANENIDNLDDFDNNEDFSNIDDYINEIHKRKNFSDESDDSSYEDDELSDNDSDISDEETKLTNQIELMKSKVVTKHQIPKRNKLIKRVTKDEETLNHAIDHNVLDKILMRRIQDSLNSNNYRSMEEFRNSISSKFKEIIEKMNPNFNPKNFEDVEPKLKKRKMDHSEEISKHHFDFWTNETSDYSIISILTLQKALTTKSANDSVNLERLEFLGDAFLKLVTCSLLFHNYPEGELGDLNVLKANAVSNKNLYAISRQKRLQEYVFADDFYVGFKWLPDGFDLEIPYSNVSGQPVTLVSAEEGFKTTGLNRVDQIIYQEVKPKTIADSIEALIGGVLIDSGMRNATLFMKFIGIYSDEYHLDLQTDQANWFNKYDPLSVDPTGKLAAFVNDIYQKNDFKSLEDSIGYEFKNKGLLIEAFKHPSYVRSDIVYPSYEKLEFLGDSVIDYLIAKYFFDDLESDFNPGQLSDLKQSLINNNFFGTLSVKYGLDKYLIEKCVTLFNTISQYKTHYEEKIRPKNVLTIPSSYLILDHKSLNDFQDDTADVDPHKALGDIFESLMGAIFIDSDFSLNTVWKVLHKFMIDELIEFKLNPPKNYLQHFYDLYPKAKFASKVENNCTIVEIQIDGKWFAGSGQNKKLAKMDCAKKVIIAYLEASRNHF